MPKYRKKPVVIEAIQFYGYPQRLPEWATPHLIIDIIPSAKMSQMPTYRVKIKTLEGVMDCPVGHWIIKGVKGEVYSCAPDIFEETYELVDA